MKTNIRALSLAVAVGFSGPLLAADLPPDAAIDRTTPNQTMKPKVVPNSGRLEWVAHDRNLTHWVTLSYDDKRSAEAPRRVELDGPLNGDVERGRKLAMSPETGNCVACHRLPGDDWPGTVGNNLLHYKRNNFPDANVFQQIYDARVFNTYSVMPPFGTNGLLTEQDIRDLTAYLQSIE